MEKIKLGLIINPIAGMGGSVGLKGTDGKVEEAIKRGATPKANLRAKEALTELLPLKEDIIILTGSGNMGEDSAKELGFDVQVIADHAKQSSNIDTINLAKELKEQQVKLILFAGGDGTAVDIYKGAGNQQPALGIPAGVKIHSSVYAKSPKTAGELTKLVLEGKNEHYKELEVLDIDEELYRQNIISTALFGYLTVPYKKIFTQNRKAPTPVTEKDAIRSIAMKVVSEMQEGVYYLIGAGTTTRGIMQELNLPYTLIGVDIIKDGKVVANDVYGSEIMKIIKGHPAKLILTVTGGQGFLFGRGNQQITPEVIRYVGKENIQIIATSEKIMALKGEPILIDTSDKELDRSLEGYYRIIAGYHESIISKVAIP